MTNSSTPLDRLIKAQSTPAVILPTYPAQYLQTTLIRRKEVERLTGLSRSRIYNLMSQGKFPKPVSLGKMSVAWLEIEVRNWIAVCISVGRGQS